RRFAAINSRRRRVDPGKARDRLRTLRPKAWWLATTSRWRTTPALHRSPTKPVLCSRFREHLKRSRRIPSLTFSGALQGNALKRERLAGLVRLPAPDAGM